MELLGKNSVASFLRKTLTVIWWLGIVLIGLFLVLSIGFLILGKPAGMQLPPFALNTDYIRVEFSRSVIKEPKTLILAFLPFGAAMLGLGMGILFQLRKIFDTLAAGNPFVLENAMRIRKIAGFIFGGVFVQFVAGTVIGQLIMANVAVDGIAFILKGSLRLKEIFLGLVMLILAEIFRQGALLKEEQDLTI